MASCNSVILEVLAAEIERLREDLKGEINQKNYLVKEAVAQRNHMQAQCEQRDNLITKLKAALYRYRDVCKDVVFALDTFDEEPIPATADEGERNNIQRAFNRVRSYAEGAPEDK